MYILSIYSNFVIPHVYSVSMVPNYKRCVYHQWSGDLGITGWDPSVYKFKWSYVDNLLVSFIKLGYILKIPLKWSVNFLQSWTSTGYFSNSTGSFVTNCRFPPIIVYHSRIALGKNLKSDYARPTYLITHILSYAIAVTMHGVVRWPFQLSFFLSFAIVSMIWNVLCGWTLWTGIVVGPGHVHLAHWLLNAYCMFVMLIEDWLP